MPPVSGVIPAGDRSHRWGLGFKQSSLGHIARVLQHPALNASRRPPLSRHATFPLSFHLEVGQVTHGPPSESIPAAPGIQQGASRRTSDTIGDHAEPLPVADDLQRDLFYRGLRAFPGMPAYVRVSSTMGVTRCLPGSPLLRKPQWAGNDGIKPRYPRSHGCPTALAPCRPEPSPTRSRTSRRSRSRPPRLSPGELKGPRSPIRLSHPARCGPPPPPPRLPSSQDGCNSPGTR